MFQAASSVRLKKENLELEKEKDLEAQASKKALLSAQQSVKDLEKKVKDLEAAVADFPRREKALVEANEEDVMAQLEMAWNSHYNEGTFDWFKGCFEWASINFYADLGVCEQPMSLDELIAEEDRKFAEEATNREEEPAEEGEGEEEARATPDDDQAAQ